MNKTPDICGRMSPTPFATYDPDTSCWRTCEATLFSDSPPFSATFPAWGMTRSGDAYERQMWGRPTVANDCSSLLPTPTAAAAKHGSTADVTANAHGYNLWDLPHLLPTPRAADNSKSGRAMTARSVDPAGQSNTPGLEEVAMLVDGTYPPHWPTVDRLAPAAQSIVMQLLPTPAAHEPGGTAEQCHARLRAHDGREPTFLPLSMAVQLLPTPTARLGRQNGGSAQAKRYTNPERSNDLDDAIAWAQQQMEVD